MTRHSLMFALIALFAPIPVMAQAPPKAAPDRLDGPPLVTAKAWIVVDGNTGKMLKGGNEAEARPMASTSKIMTAKIVLGLATADPKMLDEVVTFSERAAKTIGSSAGLKAGEKLPVSKLLYGLLLPSGNDAAVALAEHFGPRLGEKSDGDAVEQFVAYMNQMTKKLGLKEMAYKDPNGLSPNNVSSARDLATLACEVMNDERFLAYVATRRHECDVTTPDGAMRKVIWTNTNKLLDIEGFEGVKTGTTTPAGNCLVGSASRRESRLIVVVLGSTSTDGRYVDSRNLFRWGWLQTETKPSGAK